MHELPLCNAAVRWIYKDSGGRIAALILALEMWNSQKGLQVLATVGRHID
jgi:hypothetical protein